MQLLEVKGNIAKIVYNPAENHLLPSDFLLIEDSNQKLIAQIINIATTQNSSNNLAALRLLLSIDEKDNLSFYNGYIPLKSADIIYIKPDEIIELIKGEENIYLGNLSNHNECFVKVPISCVDDRIYIQSDRFDKVKVFIQNIASELISQNKKVVIIDFYGQYSSIKDAPRIKITESFKFPLNINAFNNILEYDTKDCPLEDKAVIQSIVLELREYIKTVENHFLPFTLFKTVIDKEFSANPISGLMLLRNKLWLYAQEGIFAEGKSDFEIVNKILDNQNILIIDASALESKWYKYALQTILGLINKNCYLAFSLNDMEADKKSIISLYGKNGIIPIISTTYDSKYRQILKSLCKNQILFKPSKSTNDEEPYNSFINRINSGDYILYGESTLYIPLLLELQSFDNKTKEAVNQNEITKEVDRFLSAPKKIIPDKAKIITEEQISTVSEEFKDTETEISEIDDDFTDDDLDFLDSKNDERVSYSDIQNKNDNTTSQEITYDVFSPVSDNRNTSTVEVEETEFSNKSQAPLTVQQDGFLSGINTDSEISGCDDDMLTDNTEIGDINIAKETENDIFSTADDIITENTDAEPDTISDNNINDILFEIEEQQENQLNKDTEFQELESVQKEEQLLSVDTELEQPELQIEEINPIDEEPELQIQEIKSEDEDFQIKEVNSNDEELQVQEENSEDEELQIQKVKSDNEEEKQVILETSKLSEEQEEIQNEKNPKNNLEDNNEVITETESVENSLEEIQEEKTEKSTIEEDNESEKDNSLLSLDDVITEIEEKVTNGEYDKTQEESEEESETAEEIKEEEKEAPPIKAEIKEKETPKLPYYEADTNKEEMENKIEFKAGDKVYHPKHGNGIIKGFARYSNNKIFCRIEFEDEGIRILEPLVSGLKKIS